MKSPELISIFVVTWRRLNFFPKKSRIILANQIQIALKMIEILKRFFLIPKRLIFINDRHNNENSVSINISEIIGPIDYPGMVKNFTCFFIKNWLIPVSAPVCSFISYLILCNKNLAMTKPTRCICFNF